MRTIIVTVLVATAGLAAAGLGAYLGAGRVERRITVECSTRQETRTTGLLIACSIAPGWKEYK